MQDRIPTADIYRHMFSGYLVERNGERHYFEIIGSVADAYGIIRGMTFAPTAPPEVKQLVDDQSNEFAYCREERQDDPRETKGAEVGECVENVNNALRRAFERISENYKVEFDVNVISLDLRRLYNAPLVDYRPQWNAR